jgi:uncharacterized protein
MEDAMTHLGDPNQIIYATEFTPWASLAGGIMIGLAAVLLMAVHGRIAGISGIAVRMFPPYVEKGAPGRVAFIAGVVLGPLVYACVTGAWAPLSITAGTVTLIVAGLLVGFGSVWGSGCTSGHGVCGLSRLSVRSLVAVVSFMTTAVVTVFVARHLV